MHLVCPHCGKAHIIHADALGPSGRNVRCAGCKETWFVTASGEFDDDAEKQARRTRRMEAATGLTPQAVVEQVRKAAAPAIERHVKRSKLRHRMTPQSASQFSPGVAILIGTFVMLVCGFIWRENVVRTVPNLAGLYAKAGMSVNVRGLEFSSVAPHSDMEDGQPVLVVEGKIGNITGGRVKVPPIRVMLRSPTGAEIQVATVRAEELQLNPRGVTTFKTRIANPAPDAKDILVRFIDGEQHFGG